MDSFLYDAGAGTSRRLVLITAQSRPHISFHVILLISLHFLPFVEVEKRYRVRQKGRSKVQAQKAGPVLAAIHEEWETGSDTASFFVITHVNAQCTSSWLLSPPPPLERSSHPFSYHTHLIHPPRLSGIPGGGGSGTCDCPGGTGGGGGYAAGGRPIPGGGPWPGGMRGGGGGG